MAIASAIAHQMNVQAIEAGIDMQSCANELGSHE